MSFPWNTYLMAAVAAALTTAASLPLWRRWCLRFGLVDEPGDRKIHHEPTALAGGLAVMTGLALPTLAAWLFLWWRSAPDAATLTHGLLNSSSAFLLHYGFGRRAGELATILAGAVGILLLGILDDRIELQAGVKFVGQLLVALLVTAGGTRITLFLPYPVLHWAITLLWILTLINAFNFMDNMNGLCGGIGAIAAGWFALRAAQSGQYLVALIAFLCVGALLGFLPYNFPRGRVFLGDSGSHLVGYLMAVLGVLPHFYTPRNQHRWAVLIPLGVLAIPLGDLVWVVVLRWRRGVPVYRGDTNHLSHRLVRRGLTPTQAVLLIWLMAAASGLICLL